MRIVIDARMLYWTGVGLYIRELLKHLEHEDKENEYFVLVRPEDWKLWDPEATNFHKVRVAINPYTFAEQLQLPKVIRRLAPDLVHFTAPNTPLLYRGKRVVTVHDLTLLDFDTSRGEGAGKVLRGLKRLPFRLVFWNNTRGATLLLTVTDYIRKQLMSRWHVQAKRTAVTPLAIDPQWDKPEPVDKYGIGHDYLLYVSNYYPYKNVGSSVEAFAQIAPDFPGLKLVLAGQADYFRGIVEQQVKALGLRERVIFTGRVTDGEKMTLFKEAKAYVNPSLSEGFGLQGLEAMATQVPVLSAKATCLPEVYGDAALYFNPRDARDQATKMRQMLEDQKLRERLVAAGKKRLEQFSWKTTANETLLAYEQAAGQTAK